MNRVVLGAVSLLLGGGSVAAWQNYAPQPAPLPALAAPAPQVNLAPQLAQLHDDLVALTQQVSDGTAQQSVMLKQIATTNAQIVQMAANAEAQRAQSRAAAVASDAWFHEQMRGTHR
jgi:hypothetical protein